MKKDIYSSCSPCGGTGNEIVIVPAGEGTVEQQIQCRTCNGTGITTHQCLSDDLIDQLNDMHDKINDIFEKVSE